KVIRATATSSSSSEKAARETRDRPWRTPHSEGLMTDCKSVADGGCKFITQSSGDLDVVAGFEEIQVRIGQWTIGEIERTSGYGAENLAAVPDVAVGLQRPAEEKAHIVKVGLDGAGEAQIIGARDNLVGIAGDGWVVDVRPGIVE